MKTLKAGNERLSLKMNADGSATFVSKEATLPSLNWSFFHRPTMRLSQFAPSELGRIEGADELGAFVELFSIHSDGTTEARSSFKVYESFMTARLRVKSLVGNDLSLMLFNLECESPKLKLGAAPFLRTFTSGARPLGADCPSEVQLSVLTPQTGVISGSGSKKSLIAANIDATETFGFLLDSPKSGSLAFCFPIEDEFSCGRRTLKGGAVYESDRIFIATSSDASPVEAFAPLRKAFATLHPPRVNPAADKIKTLWNSWYAYKSGINEECVSKAIDFAAEHHVDAVEIDDGWMEKPDLIPAEAESADWEVSKEKFPRGFAPLVEKAKSKNVKILLWHRPYLIAPSDKLFKTRPDLFLRRADGSLIHWVAGFLLDPSHPFVGPYLERQFARFNKAGIAGYKVDFLGPLIAMQSANLKDGLTRPGDWMRLMWKQLSKAIGPDKLIHSSTPMCPSPAFWPYYDAVRIWGDNDPYFHRGLAGYAALPFANALFNGLPVRTDPDMVFPSAQWKLLCDAKFDKKIFLDSLGCSFVSGTFYITESFETFDKTAREAFKLLAANYRKRDFVPDKLGGGASFVFDDGNEFIVFARAAKRVKTPADGKRSGFLLAEDLSIKKISGVSGASVSLKAGELLLLKRS